VVPDRLSFPVRACVSSSDERPEGALAVPTIQLQGADGLHLTADAEGDPARPPVVLLHGGGQTRHAWGTTLHILGQHWYAVSVDLRGHGDSEWAADGDYSLDAFARDIRVLAASFDQPPVLVGASLGGISSIAAIGEEPRADAAGLVLVDVAPRVEEAGVKRIGAFMTGNLDGFASLEEVADLIAAYNPHRPRPTDLSGLKKNLRQRDDGRWVWHWDPAFIGGRFGSIDETRTRSVATDRSSLVDGQRLQRAAATITIPTLLVRGRMSDLLSEEGAQELLQLVPHAQLVDVAGAGHMVAGDRNDLFNDAVVSFVESVRTG
jgi:pimeloyl-ACP methyl ester carboxylesterase